jgi:hypothetical protein|nr:MAG TPA: hypothetical protein [Caudoviricetes sp.]
MTLEDLKKHAKPLVWENDELVSRTCLPNNQEGIYSFIFIYRRGSGKYYSNIGDKGYETKEEAMQSVEEYHLRELAKFFELED